MPNSAPCIDETAGYDKCTDLSNGMMRLLDALDYDDCEVSIVLTTDVEIKELNQQWRDKDESTDVLSFPQHEPDFVPEQSASLGDIVISVETAQRQADDRGHSLEDELRILLVHGLCHLMGHDHIESSGADIMRSLENQLLRVIKGDDSGPVDGLIQMAYGKSNV